MYRIFRTCSLTRSRCNRIVILYMPDYFLDSLSSVRKYMRCVKYALDVITGRKGDRKRGYYIIICCSRKSHKLGYKICCKKIYSIHPHFTIHMIEYITRSIKVESVLFYKKKVQKKQTVSKRHMTFGQV